MTKLIEVFVRAGEFALLTWAAFETSGLLQILLFAFVGMGLLAMISLATLGETTNG